MKYPKLDRKCKKCLGCNRLENPLFTGVDKCEYYIQQVKEAEKNKAIQVKIDDVLGGI